MKLTDAINPGPFLEITSDNLVRSQVNEITDDVLEQLVEAIANRVIEKLNKDVTSN